MAAGEMFKSLGNRATRVPGAGSVVWPVTLLAAVAVMLLGGITPLTSAIIAALVLALTLNVQWRARLSFNGLALCFALLALFTVFQALPLPGAVAALFAPASFAAQQETYALLGENVAFVSLSLEPSATRVEALNLTTYALFALLAQRAAAFGARWLCAALAGIAMLAAVVTLGHHVVGAVRVWGWYRPQYSGFVGPLLNSNNLGGLLNVGFFAASGLMLDPRLPGPWRHVALFACTFLAAGSWWVGSRAAGALLLLGTLLIVGRELKATWRRGEIWPKKEAGFLLLSLLVGGAMAAFSAARLQHELLDESLEKLAVVTPALAALREHWLFGAGRGAFGVAVAPHAPPGVALGSFEHAESFPLQWAVDWGPWVTGLLLLLLLRWLWPRAEVRRVSPSRFGAYVALVALWLHNLVDFSLEVPAVVLCAILAAAAVGLLGRAEPIAVAPGRRVWVPLLAALALAQLIAFGVAPVELGRSARQRLAHLSALQQLRVSDVRDALLQHPADAYLLRLAAAAYQYKPNAPAWLTLALRRGPNSGRTLLLLADVVQQHGGTAQALGALRQALVVEPELADEVVRRALAWAPERVDAIVPEGPHAVPALTSLADQVADVRQRLGYRIRAAQHVSATDVQRIVLLRDALLASDADCVAVLAQPCEGFVRAARAQLETNDALHLIEIDARLLLHRGEPAAALGVLMERCPRTGAGLSCLYTLLSVARQVGLEEQLKAGELLLRVACPGDTTCSAAEAHVAAELLARGEPSLALPHFKRAAELEPSAARWLAFGNAARDAARLQPLSEALVRLQELGADVPAELIEAREKLQQQGAP